MYWSDFFLTVKWEIGLKRASMSMWHFSLDIDAEKRKDVLNHRLLV
jgi:hypothetical protein